MDTSTRHHGKTARALKALRARHTDPDRLRRAARIAGQIYLAEVTEGHAANGMPPVDSGLDVSQWCRECNTRRPCEPMRRAAKLASIGRHPSNSDGGDDLLVALRRADRASLDRIEDDHAAVADGLCLSCRVAVPCGLLRAVRIVNERDPDTGTVLDAAPDRRPPRPRPGT